RDTRVMAEGLSRGAYIGMRALRREDARLLAGRGRFVGAVRLPGMLHAVVVRSQIAHGRLVRCDVGSAGAVGGGVGVITADSAADCAEAIASAHHVVEMTFRFGRASPYPLEPRGIVASFTDGELTIWTSTQAPHHVRDHAADALGLGQGRVRVISHDTGGGF